MSKLLVFAGPNGSGKSTITSGMKIFGNYVNADIIKKSMNCSDLEAAQIATATREHLLAHNLDFTFETVLSTTRNIELMQQAKEQGYYIVCIYALTCNPDINVARVKQRFEKGGHFVEEDKVRSRYFKALRLIPTLFSICNELYIFDNSNEAGNGEPAMILSSVNGKIEASPNEHWNKDMLKSLVAGKYPDEYILNND